MINGLVLKRSGVFLHVLCYCFFLMVMFLLLVGSNGAKARK